MAAALRREGVEVTMVPGPYGKFTVLVDDEPVVDGGALAFLGVLPSLPTIRDRVTAKLGRSPGQRGDSDREA